MSYEADRSKSPVGRFRAGPRHTRSWPRSADGGVPEVGIAFYVTEVPPGAHPTSDTNTEVSGRPARIEHRSDADAVAWMWSPTVGLRVESNVGDYRVNCEELLAIA